MVSTPNWIEKLAAEAKRAGETEWQGRDHLTGILRDYVEAAVAQGKLNSRDDVIATLKSIGVEVVRQNQKSITILAGPEKDIRVRLKGRVFQETFVSAETLRPDRAKLDLAECEGRLKTLRARRADSHQKRYGGPLWDVSFPPCGHKIDAPVFLGVATSQDNASRSAKSNMGECAIVVIEDDMQKRARYKARLFEILYGMTLAEELILALHYVDRAKRAIQLKDGARIIDHGDRISSTHTTEVAVKLMLAEAQAKDWQIITLTGSDAFKQLASTEAAKLGIAVSNPECRNLYSLTRKDVNNGHINADGARLNGNEQSNDTGSDRTAPRGRLDAAGDGGSGSSDQQLNKSVRRLSRAVRAGGLPAKQRYEGLKLDIAKTTLDLRQVAGQLNFTVDQRASDRNHTVMRHGDGSKLIIGVAASGHWVFSSNASVTGSGVDLLQWRLSLSTPEAVKTFRNWDREYAETVLVDYGAKPRPQSRDGNALQAKVEWEAADDAGSSKYLKEYRGLKEDTLVCPRFTGTHREDGRGNAVFPYMRLDGLVGVERRNRGGKPYDPSFKAYTKGALPGLWRSNAQERDSRLVVVESPIDAMSHYQMLSPQLREGVRYIAMRNGCKDADIQSEIRKMPKGAVIVSACDRDEAGERYSLKIAELAARLGYAYERNLPETGNNDWNEALKNQQNRAVYEKFKRGRRL